MTVAPNYNVIIFHCFNIIYQFFQTLYNINIFTLERIIKSSEKQTNQYQGGRPTVI